MNARRGAKAGAVAVWNKLWPWLFWIALIGAVGFANGIQETP